jgi:COP9 signalosome complex subunit 5
MSSGKVDLGCFRTFPESYIAELEKQGGGGPGSKALVPPEKVEDFGIHAYKYYQLDHSFFKSSLDLTVLESLWNEYWI